MDYVGHVALSVRAGGGLAAAWRQAGGRTGGQAEIARSDFDLFLQKWIILLCLIHLRNSSIHALLLFQATRPINHQNVNTVKANKVYQHKVYQKLPKLLRTCRWRQAFVYMSA